MRKEGEEQGGKLTEGKKEGEEEGGRCEGRRWERSRGGEACKKSQVRRCRQNRTGRREREGQGKDHPEEDEQTDRCKVTKRQKNRKEQNRGTE